MADAQETIADIIAEMRGYAAGMPPSYHVTMSWADFRRMLDRFEAVWKRDTKELRVEIERLKEERNYSGVRERERLRANGFAIVPKEQLERGDCAKLREACANIAEYARSAICHATDAHLLGYLNQIEGWSKAALAAPPRNCDVGTAEEQYKRFMNMCNSKDVRQCTECSMRGFTPGCSRDRCFANWAQMPYKGGAK